MVFSLRPVDEINGAPYNEFQGNREKYFEFLRGRMKLTLYGILVILALFIILMIFNPSLSCFGRRLKSPFYPMIRKKKRKQIKKHTVDYGFDQGGTGQKRHKETSAQKGAPEKSRSKRPSNVSEEYGFDLGGRSKKKQA